MAHEITVPWLEDVGISPQVISNTGIKTTRNGIRYPCQYPPRIDPETEAVVYDNVYRTRFDPDWLSEENERRRKAGEKRLGKTINPKKDTLPEAHDKELPILYMWNFHALQRAVKDNGGVLWLCEGDKDTWTLHSVGITNSAGILSTGAKVVQLLTYYLRQLGVSHVNFLPDSDNSGIGLAEKIYQILNSNNIGFAIYSLGTYISNTDILIKDVNDLHVGLDCDPIKTKAYIDNLREFKLASQKQREWSETNDYFIPEFYTEIKARLGITKFRKDRPELSEHVPCPVVKHPNDDTDPKFAWDDKHRIGICLKCGRQYLAKEVAESLGMDYRKYVTRGQERQKPVTSDTPDTEIPVQQKGNSNPFGANATLLNLPGSFMQNIAPRLAEMEAIPDDNLVYYFDQALDDYELRMRGEIPSEYPPIENPVSMFHHLGGAGRVLPRPYMVGVLGVSGGYKTTFLTWIVNTLVYKGYDVIVWTPEWSPEKNADRVIQNFGGMKMFEMNMLARYWAERDMLDRGLIEPGDRSLFGRMPDEDTLVNTKLAIDNIRGAFRGRIGYLRSFSPDIFTLIAQLIRVHTIMTRDGHRPAVFIMDYAQMADSPPDMWRWRTKDTIHYVKQATMMLGMVTFMASQVRKADTEKVIGAGGLLTSTSGLDFHDHEFNFFMTVNPRGITHMDDGRHLQEVKVAVTKNSDGRKAETEDNAPSFFVDTDRMLVLEDIYSNAPVMAVSGHDPDHIDNQNNSYTADDENAPGFARYIEDSGYDEDDFIDGGDYNQPDDIGFLGID